MSKVDIAQKRKKNKGVLRSYIEHYDLFLLFLPGLLSLVVFSIFPMYGLIIAFKDFKMTEGILGSAWVGLEHFKNLFGRSSADFTGILFNTLSISALRLLFGFPAPIILALLLNEVRANHFKKIVQTISYLPHFFSWVVLSGIIIMVFAPSGPINMILMKLGMNEPLMFFGNNFLFIVLLIITSIWQSVGWSSILYLATLAGIDSSLYEAAAIDGAGRFKQMIHISIPGLIPTVATIFILNLGSVLNAGFDQIYNLYNPLVYEVSDILDTYVLRKMQEMNYSLGTAVGLFKSVVGLILVFTSNLIIKKISNGEQGIL